MANIDDDLAAAIAGLLGGRSLDGTSEDQEPEHESPEMSDAFFDKLANYERKVND